MTSERLVLVQYCDDVRHEVGNKFSLMGCYSEELIAEKLPAILPKLCAQVRVITPIDQPFERLSLRAVLNDEVIGELEIPSEMLDASKTSFVPRPESTRLILVVVMTFSPLVVSEPSTLRIDADTETGTLRGTRLTLRARDPSEMHEGDSGGAVDAKDR